MSHSSGSASATHCNTRCNTHCSTNCNTLKTLQHLQTHVTLSHSSGSAPSTYCINLQHTATHCNTHCNTLQHTVQHLPTHVAGSYRSWIRVFNAFVHEKEKRKTIVTLSHSSRSASSTHCNTLRRTAPHCNTHCNTYRLISCHTALDPRLQRLSCAHEKKGKKRKKKHAR